MSRHVSSVVFRPSFAVRFLAAVLAIGTPISVLGQSSDSPLPADTSADSGSAEHGPKDRDRVTALKWLEQATSYATKEDETLKCKHLLMIAKLQDQLNDEAASKRSIELAIASFSRIPDKRRNLVSEDMLEAGCFDEMIQWAYRISDQGTKVYRLIRIADAQLGADDRQGFTKTIRMANLAASAVKPSPIGLQCAIAASEAQVDYKAAIKRMQELLRGKLTDGERTTALYYLSICYAKAGDVEKAQATAAKITNLNPGFEYFIKLEIIKAQLRAGKLEAAEATTNTFDGEWSAIRRRQPYALIGEYLRKHGDRKKLREIIAKAKEDAQSMTDESSRQEYLSEIGELELRAGEFESSRQTLELLEAVTSGGPGATRLRAALSDPATVEASIADLPVKQRAAHYLNAAAGLIARSEAEAKSDASPSED